MPSAEGKAGDLAPKPDFQSVAAKGEAGTIGSAVGVGASIVEAVGNASGSSWARAESGSIVTIGSEVQPKIGRAPFNEPGMAERFSAAPEFYRNLAALVASEIRRKADTLDGSGNQGAVEKGQLTELADGFQDIADKLTTTSGILTPAAASLAAAAVTKVRETYAALAENCPGLLKFAQVGLAAVALCQFGLFDPNYVLSVSAAVIGGVGVASALGKKKD